MATEPDDYQSTSDNCPGYMVLIAEGIICTRCAGEKRHKPNECPKPSTAADLARDTVRDADPTEIENADPGMDSLSDTDSVSSESTAGSEDSETRVVNAHQSDQGGSHPQNTHLPKRGFARPDGSYTSTEPDRVSPFPPDHRAVQHPGEIHGIFVKADSQVSATATQETEPQARRECNFTCDPNSLASVETSSFVMPGATISTELLSVDKHSVIEQRDDRSRDRSHPQCLSRQFDAYEAHGDRFPSKSLAVATGKFEYSNTTCPSSFGFGRLPSEAMG